MDYEKVRGSGDEQTSSSHPLTASQKTNWRGEIRKEKEENVPIKIEFLLLILNRITRVE